ncbi:MAG: FtsQ-type POTRA domain-containing protein [Bacilli bacterium]|nr:FtsQ-type POTRA domain-containing protein [Bacilli bacterium]
MGKSKNRKRKLNKKRLFIVLILFFLLSFIIVKVFNSNIKNIYVKGNELLTDQEIIDIAGIEDYPTSINNLSVTLESRLEKNQYILEADVTKSNLTSKITIEVKENYPMFYYQTENKTILYNNDKVTEKFTTPTVINQIPNTVYDKFLKAMKKVKKNILYRMSEIEYSPNEVDEERFFILMNDGNYVYLTLDKFLAINKYIDMVKSFDNKKGILYLDSGEYFDIFDE